MAESRVSETRQRWLRRPPNTLTQKGQAQRDESGAFLVILAVAMAASGGFVVARVVAERLELGRHLAGVAGMHTIVLARGRDQDRWIGPACFGQVIGGIGL